MSVIMYDLTITMSVIMYDLSITMSAISVQDEFKKSVSKLFVSCDAYISYTLILTMLDIMYKHISMFCTVVNKLPTLSTYDIITHKIKCTSVSHWT